MCTVMTLELVRYIVGYPEMFLMIVECFMNPSEKIIQTEWSKEQ